MIYNKLNLIRATKDISGQPDRLQLARSNQLPLFQLIIPNLGNHLRVLKCKLLMN